MKLIRKKEMEQPASGAQPRLSGPSSAAEQETNKEIRIVTWFHEEEVLLPQQTSEIEFDLELPGRNSRAPKLSPWAFRLLKAWGSSFLGRGYMGG